MISFKYKAVEGNGNQVKGVIEAEDRRQALRLLSERGLYPSSLDAGQGTANIPASPGEQSRKGATRSGFKSRSRVGRKQVTAFTREMSALLGAGIPIPQALDGLGEEEDHPSLKAVVLQLSESVRTGAAFSAALEEHPQLFDRLYVSMVRVGEEAGALPKVLDDLADLLEREDEVRGEVVSAVAYPLFVLGFGFVTVAILLTFVMPKLFGMLQDMLTVLPLPTLILLKVSGFLKSYGIWLLIASGILVAVIARWIQTPRGRETADRIKLGIPVVGGIFRSAALGRFARTLGTLARSGVSLLPALKIVENSMGNVVLARLIAQVAEETRGGDSLAGPLRKLGVFPRTVVQMISVGEESGKLDEMLLKVADIEERQMRSRTKTMISLLAPVLILLVGALVGFMVIALLLPIFKMSRAIR